MPKLLSHQEPIGGDAQTGVVMEASPTSAFCDLVTLWFSK
jgi:hypothetical protein